MAGRQLVKGLAIEQEVWAIPFESPYSRLQQTAAGMQLQAAAGSSCTEWDVSGQVDSIVKSEAASFRCALIVIISSLARRSPFPPPLAAKRK